jgi:hypothetical protein
LNTAEDAKELIQTMQLTNRVSDVHIQLKRGCTLDKTSVGPKTQTLERKKKHLKEAPHVKQMIMTRRKFG